MDFDLTEEQRAIRDAVARICSRFDDAYWLERERTGTFPEDFAAEIAKGGFYGVTMEEQYGGSGLGITEASLVMQEIGRYGAAASSAVHINIFGLQPVVGFGTDEQKARMLPPLIRGEHRSCFGVTEPDAGLDTTHISTFARRREDGGYVVNGRKVWTSTAQRADHILLVTRTTPIEDCERPTDGMSVFYTDFDRSKIDVHEIAKMGRKAVDSNAIFIDGLEVPEEDRIGAEGEGFKVLLHGLNAERIIVAAAAVGFGMYVLEKAAAYARERVVFDRPIGQNQAIQHPLASVWMRLQAAELMTYKAATLYDQGKPCGLEANTARNLAGSAAYEAAFRAVRTHGGFGFAQEYHVERYFRESVLNFIAPVSEELILSYVAEKALGMPKSY
ncbi:MULTISPECIES: acyl-CoA dehydrogenase family protein [Alphaproteobacteria]|jgi:acyl-CoA dehydrogenase|uniref:Acyl-CoA dehydrogenase n=4 Tax=Rhodobacterales TaxID=204455 RepID=A0A1I7ACE1_9RHOB|nr:MULTISPECIES: acyl-CoA dehydrogenase family protein [Alphaproteobacteria]MBL3704897.1 acyl-CoA dehydrogenase [Sulfitobacter sp. BDSS02]MBR9851813.1 acyl-CoA/acyl-ACP dehydrogenase [Paracoccaceae bacterium]MCS5603290.1 acyl-CoA/acyl-ACP dehydrogenase [Paracoccus sp. (in: a-proteobacteria)]MEC7257725.1 acyl-CoA dehydrogenase family protein [Pseudomonadota bacterium]APE46139.1 acyl-CoA dehydrogenase [Sulfitobacter alexandrii]|tara:strand:- start:1238 stop:2401 length:1164 start_codon:yes stop_codon:yes gene_type:complete